MAHKFGNLPDEKCYAMTHVSCTESGREGYRLISNLKLEQSCIVQSAGTRAAQTRRGAKRRCRQDPRGSLVSCSTAERPALLRPALRCKGSNGDDGDGNENGKEQR